VAQKPPVAGRPSNTSSMRRTVHRMYRSYLRRESPPQVEGQEDSPQMGGREGPGHEVRKGGIQESGRITHG